MLSPDLERHPNQLPTAEDSALYTVQGCQCVDDDDDRHGRLEMVVSVFLKLLFVVSMMIAVYLLWCVSGIYICRSPGHPALSHTLWAVFPVKMVY